MFVNNALVQPPFAWGGSVNNSPGSASKQYAQIQSGVTGGALGTAWTFYCWFRFNANSDGTYGLLTNTSAGILAIGSNTTTDYLTLKVACPSASASYSVMTSYLGIKKPSTTDVAVPGTATVAQAASQPHMLAMVRRSDNTASVYIDGITTQTLGAGADRFPSSFGANTILLANVDTTQWAKVRLAEVDMLGISLTDDDIRLMWNGGLGSNYRDRAHSGTPSLIRYHCDEASGLLLTDASGNGRTMDLKATTPPHSGFTSFL